MRLLFAIVLIALALVLVAVVLLVRPAWSATRCTTHEEGTLGRLQTLCANGSRTTSYGNPKTACTGLTPPLTGLTTHPRTTPRLCTPYLTPDEENLPHVY